MTNYYGDLAFSSASKVLQEKYGSRKAYARMEGQSQTGGLTENEKMFISMMDGFYLSTIGPNGFPYLQFRGGPAGFLRVVDETTLAFADYRGNKQYITTGNLRTNSKAALILLDYASQTRLKILAEAKTVELDQDPALVMGLMPPGYNAKPERAMMLTVKAFDWNCPQHITPRYTEKEIHEALKHQTQYISDLERENRELKIALSQRL